LELFVLALYAADFDGDGDVDNTDLGIWELAYGATDLGDADDDSDSDGNDFLVWQQQFTGSLALAAAAVVPEPATGTLALCLLGVCAFRHPRSIWQVSEQR
jgi:hypothetical protein